MDISSAFLWEMLRTVPSLLPQTCFKDVKQPVERLGKGVNNFKTYRRAKFFQTIIFSILRCICRSEVEKKGKRKWTSGRSFGTFQSVQNLLSCYLVYP